MKEFVIKVSDNESLDKHAQAVWSCNDEQNVYFYVYDLYEYPEDAIIGRSLFDADDFIETLKLGFRIARKGYDRIVVEQEPWEDF